ncbi:DUF4436 family protein [Streptomyces sp. NPDC004266]|uniref:DUF4436 family protein n=1 Tax=Streptomyces sp. NPDC004266 TaxID=3364693 RepID=UPI0036BAC08F
MSETRPPIPLRTKLLAPGLVLFAVVAAVTVGGWLQFDERQTLDTVHSTGSSAPDRVDVRATVQHVDAAGRELVLRVTVVPRGELAEAGGVSPRQDLVLQTSASTGGDLAFKAHSRISSRDLPVYLTGGLITDYPFDAYAADIEFGATAGGERVPVRIELSNNDALFSAVMDASGDEDVAAFGVDLSRSNSVLVFAAFMMVAMWALAVSVLIGAWFLLTRRHGMTWPALGWMAATLFALAAFRNTAPGTPPIGSLLDYLAFFWAETVIVLCLVTVVVMALRVEQRATDPAAP